MQKNETNKKEIYFMRKNVQSILNKWRGGHRYSLRNLGFIRKSLKMFRISKKSLGWNKISLKCIACYKFFLTNFFINFFKNLKFSCLNLIQTKNKLITIKPVSGRWKICFVAVWVFMFFCSIFIWIYCCFSSSTNNCLFPF